MSVFKDHYARYYDLLYADKDYQAEVSYVVSLVRSHCPGASRILELGCGTGRHATLLARLGFGVYGIDRSEQMVSQARVRRQSLPPPLRRRLNFSVNDVTRFSSKKQFDVVISLFHVVSYQASTNSLARMFRIAGRHLRDGGIFIFDVWYGPAVLHQRPSVRTKRLEDDEITFTRLAKPTLDLRRHTVRVDYTIQSTEKSSGRTSQFQESHVMRYFFTPEINSLLAKARLKLVLAEEWMTKRSPGKDTWGVCFVGRR